MLRYWCCRWSIHGLHSWNWNPKRWLELSESFTNKKLIKEQSSLSKTHTVLKAVLGKDKIKREMHRKFHLVYLFRNQLERFWRNFRASFKIPKPASKTRSPKNMYLRPFNDLKFSFLKILYFKCAHRRCGTPIFTGKSVLKCI